MIDISVKKPSASETAELDLLKSLFETSADAIELLRALRDENGEVYDFRFVLTNSIASERRQMQLEDRCLSETLDCDEAPELLKAFAEVMGCGIPLDKEICCTRTSETRWYHLTASRHSDFLISRSADITARKRIELELRARNEELEILNTIHETAEAISNSGTYTYDVETGQAWFSDNLYRIFGVAPGQFTPSFDSVFAFIHPDDREKRMREGKLFISDGGNYVGEYRVVRPDGEIRLLRNVNCNHTLRNGRKVLLGITQDVTEQKQVMDRIEETRLFANRIANSIPDITYVMDLQTCQFIYVNNNSPHSFEVTPEELREDGKSVLKRLVHPDDLPRLLMQLTELKLSNEHEMHEMEVRVLCNNTEYRCFRLRDSAFKRNSNGEVTQIIGLATDITERKMVREKLRKQESLMREAERLGAMGSWERNISTNDLIWSEGMYKLFGLEQGVVDPSSFDYISALVHPEDRTRVQKAVSKLYTKFCTDEFRYRIRRNDGIELVLSAKPQIIYNEGTPMVIRGIIRDITREVRMEEERMLMRVQLQKQVTKAVMNAQEEERQSIGEALHNGVGQMLFAAKLLLENAGGSAESFQKIRSILDEAQKQTKSISFGLVPPLIRDYGLQAAVQDMISRQVTQSDLDISLSFKGRMKRFNGSDEIAVFRIIQELINNTVKHAKASTATILLVQKKNDIQISYQDNGKGFDVEKTLKSCAGFGLRSIRTRVDLLSGKMSIESSPDVGSRFMITLSCRANV